MKPLIFLFYLLAFLSSYSLAQGVNIAKDTSSGDDHEITIGGKIISIDSSDNHNAFKCTIAIGNPVKKIMILVPASALSRSSISYLVIGQSINVDGLIKSNGEIYLEARNISLSKNISISRIMVTHVVLTPPPVAHYWGEQVKGVDINKISEHVGDTVKVIDEIFGYKLLANMTILYLGAAYPDQKLTVILTDGAKEYLTAQINLQGRGDVSEYLQEKRLSVIGLVIQNDGKLQISTKEPDGFIVEDK
jgi:hypothetical protein